MSGPSGRTISLLGATLDWNEAVFLAGLVALVAVSWLNMIGGYVSRRRNRPPKNRVGT